MHTLKKTICTNCGKHNHDFKQCKHPITSWGIILVRLNNFDHPVHNKNIDIEQYSYEHKTGNIEVSDINEKCKAGIASTSIQFLMISRKNSLGYVEFIRGRYKPHMIDQTIYLFRQMKQCEINKIRDSLEMENGFQYIWEDLWGTFDTSYMTKEKIESKNKYDEMKFTGINGPEINLYFIVNNVKPDYDTEEWGFPKGRRNKDETEYECAIREFKEETGFTEEDFKIIQEINPINETFIGTNGIKYCHMYYVAEQVGFKMPQNNTTEQQKNEIGHIDFFDFNTSIEYVRDYHLERKNIIRNLYVYYVNTLLERQPSNT